MALSICSHATAVGDGSAAGKSFLPHTALSLEVVMFAALTAKEGVRNLDQWLLRHRPELVGTHRAAMSQGSQVLLSPLLGDGLFRPLMLATKPMPQASCSFLGL